jgi:zinc transporter
MKNLNSAPYGSDPSGLICGYRFEPNAPGTPLDSTQVLQWLQSPRHGDDTSFIWLHFNLVHTGAIPWLRTHLSLSEMFYEALHEGTRSTSVEYADGALLATVNDVLFDFSFDPDSVASLWLSVDSRIMVSARTKPLKTIDRMRIAVNGGETFRSSAEMLVHLLRDQADVLVQIVRETTRKIDSIEDNLLAKRLSVSRADLGALRRMLVRLQRLLAPEPAAMFRLLNRPPAWTLDDDIQELRHSTEEFSAVINDMTTLIERVKLLQEEIAAMVNEQDNRSLFVLTVVTVMALPFNVIGGLLGMNVGGIPFADQPHGFAYIVALVAVFTVVIGWFAFRNRRD